MQELYDSLFRLGWFESEPPLPIYLESVPGEACILRHLLAQSTPPYLNRRARQLFSDAVAAGWTLRSGWPRAWSGCVEGWLGKRFYFSHVSLFTNSVPLISIVSSRIGRHGRKLPVWPELINVALRNIYDRGGRLLICPGTTCHRVVTQYSQRATIACAEVYWSKQKQLGDWITELLCQDLTSLKSNTKLSSHSCGLFLSPRIDDVPLDLEDDLPLQDRIAIALADSIYALSIRANGKIEQLLEERLKERSFPPAQVFIALTDPTSPSAQVPPHHWLDRGAVGWFVRREQPDIQPCWRGCRESISSATAFVQQLCSGFPDHWSELSADQEWSYLCHCTRGVTGPLPEESLESYHCRLWLQGSHVEWQPLETLARICAERRLLGTSTMTRTPLRSVSLSAVPLVPLLNRRSFQSHLNRWDWEPYGLVINRQALRKLGAKPVIYGSQHDFDNLSDEARPFFQPVGKARRGSKADWTAEREWRILGDLDLRKLTRSSVRVFVRTHREAIQLSRWSPWPILWFEPDA